MENNDIKKLNEFIVNFDDELKKIHLSEKNDNIFKILKIEQKEHVHSDFLAWLLDSKKGHGLENKFLKKLLSQLWENNIKIFPYLDNYEVKREKDNIDILIISREEKFVICIENKIESFEHDDQLNKYREYIDNEYKEYNKIFVFLDAKGNESSDNENWISISYQTIYDILKEILNKENLSNETMYLIKNYLKILEESYIENKELKEECQKLYDKYKDVWEIIQINSESFLDKIKNNVIAYLKNYEEKNKIIIFNGRNKSILSEIYFCTKIMQDKFNTTNEIFWDIYISREKITIGIWTKNFQDLGEEKSREIKEKWNNYICERTSEKDRFSTSIQLNIDDNTESKIPLILDEIVNYEWNNKFDGIKNIIRKIVND